MLVIVDKEKGKSSMIRFIFWSFSIVI